MQIVVSVKEVKNLLKEKHNLPDNVDIVIKDIVVEDEDGWITVPKDWKEYYCPTFLNNEYLEVTLRDGRIVKDYADGFGVCWVQNDHRSDAVKYRLAK
jgi:TPP-dependent 2-oxoacid decarboxylase